MKLLEERIIKDGNVKNGSILKVDSFVNHQIDVELYEELGKEVRRLFDTHNITKVLTIEASGIAFAYAAAKEFGVPALFAKKNKTKNIDGEVYATAVESFTHGLTYTIIVSHKFLTADDTVLIVDDFLAHGNALRGLIDICNQAGAKIAGCSILVEKAFQDGRKNLAGLGVHVESLAIIEKMDENGIVFGKNPEWQA